MANRMKEDEKNEKIIRGLMKLPANRRCINCNSLGPQYVCTNFWTFVCTNCSGIHREFTHRVKSVSMAKFSSQEVSALQGGGNERAKEIYLKEWDSQKSAPDSSNVERLRDFIKHVYVDRRYTGDRSIDKPPRAKTGDKEESYENRRVDTYRSGSRSPPYEDTYDRYGDRSSPAGRNHEERRSPGYGQESRYSDNKKSPGRFEVVDDWRRDDRFGNGRRSEERRVSDGESKSGGRSPNHQKDLGVSSPPVVRPVRDILGEDAPPLRIGEPPKANGSKVADVPAHTQRTASSSSLGSFDGNIGSLIDFNADPEPPNVTAPPPAQPVITSTVQSAAQPTASTSTDDGNWASFDFATQTQTQTQTQAPVQAQVQAPSNVNSLESVLSQLSGPSTAPVSNMSVFPTGGGAPITSSLGNMYTPPNSYSSSAPNVSTLPSSGGASAVAPGGMFAPMPVSGGESFVRANEGAQWPNVQQHFTQSVGGVPNNQPWNPLAQGAHGPLSTTGQPSSIPTQESSGGVASQPATTEPKRSGREALPEDLFASTYSAFPAQIPRWHAGSSHGMGFGVQYPTAAPVPTFPHPSRATNPFDINNEPTMVHAASFPNMASLQGALPNTEAPLGLLRTSSVGAPPMGWMPQQSPMQPPLYASAMQTPSFASAMPQSTFMGQQVPPSSMPAMGHQGMGGFGGDTAFHGTSSMDQQLDSRYSQPTMQTSFPSHGGGNPFG